ncbi:MAG TPA: hypothetical protein VF981_09330 [Gemmatimonadaceae bacterium]
MHYSRMIAVPAMLLAVTTATAPAQKVDTVRVGSTSLLPSLLKPGTYVHDNYRVTGGERTFVSRTTQSVAAVGSGELGTFLIRTVHEAATDTGHSAIVVRQSDLQLVHHQVRARRDSVDVTVNGDYLTGWSVLPQSPPLLIGARLAHRVFPIEGQIPWLMGLLDLKDGYVAAIPHYTEWAGTEAWSRIEVLGSERVPVGDYTFDCWKLDLGPFGPPGYRFTRWVDKRSRRVVQSVLKGADGEPEYWSWAVRP